MPVSDRELVETVRTAHNGQSGDVPPLIPFSARAMWSVFAALWLYTLTGLVVLVVLDKTGLGEKLLNALF